MEEVREPDSVERASGSEVAVVPLPPNDVQVGFTDQTKGVNRMTAVGVACGDIIDKQELYATITRLRSTTNESGQR